MNVGIKNNGHTGAPFTAAQIAAALAVTPQAIRKALRDIAPTTVRIVAGNESAAWLVDSLPLALRQRLEGAVVQQRCRDVAALLSMPRKQWQPALQINQICERDVTQASKLRDALLPSLLRQHDFAGSGAEFEAEGIKDYAKAFGHTVTPRHWRGLFKRTLQRDAGAENWNRLEIYLCDNPSPRTRLQHELPASVTKDFQELREFISKLNNPSSPTEWDYTGVWNLAFEKHSDFVRSGRSRSGSARLVRNFLLQALPVIAPNKNALRMAFDRRLNRWESGKPESLNDGRKRNGDRASYPREDVRLVRHSAVLKNGGRIDAAWREEYRNLSEYTRQRHAHSRKCPSPFYKMVNRKKVDALLARVKGRRALRRLVGGVTRSAENIPAMARWAVDDMTSNIEIVSRNPDGSVLLCQPQLIVVMDFASRKWVGWAMSIDKAPTAKLVCAAILDGFRRHGVPHQLWVENGFVFGKSLDVNGKEDEQGRTIVSGLAHYGCTIHHFDKMSPTSKGELEKSFDLFQRMMERHPGYTGRNQMLDASEDFKREQRLIRSGKVDPKKFRYTFDEFVTVIQRLVEEYNSNPQYGLLNGLSPNEAFGNLSDPENPPIRFQNQHHWMLANSRHLVHVKAGGVRFKFQGREIRVRGGELAKAERIDSELWALVDREDTSMVTFMSLDYSETFTVESCQEPSANETPIASGTSVLAAELEKIGQHVRTVEDDLRELTSEFGNPRRDLLTDLRAETTARTPSAPERAILIDSQLSDSADQMSQQREALREEKKQKAQYRRRAQTIADETGLALPADGIGKLTPEQLNKLRNYMNSEEAV